MLDNKILFDISLTDFIVTHTVIIVTQPIMWLLL